MRLRALSVLAGSLILTPVAVGAEPPQGRTVAAVPVGPNITQASVGDGVMFEKQRIKRTPPLDPAVGLDGKWDTLYSVQDTGGPRTVYLDWDDTYLYLALEAPQPVEARFDLDLRDDGWLRGADNLSLVVTPPADGAAPDVLPALTAQRFDMAQNRDQPVWAASPVPASEIKVRSGRTQRGYYGVTLAIPRTEAMGLSRKPGDSFGIRVETAPKLTPSAGEANLIPVRPMLRVALADSVDATDSGLLVRVSVSGAREIAPGGEVKATLEIRNTSAATRRVGRLFLGGSLSDTDFVDEGKFAGVDIEPGKSVKRDIKSRVAPAAPTGAIVLTGGADIEGVGTIASLTSFDKVEPYAIALEVEDKPVPPGGDYGRDAVRSAKVVIRSHVNKRVTAVAHIQLPTGWKLINEKDGKPGKIDRDIALTFDGDLKGAEYKFVVPVSAGQGAYPVGVTVEVGGQTYKASGSLIVAQ